MTYVIEYTERARNHLLEIVDWIADKSPPAAERWLDRLEEAVGSLNRDPKRFASAPENAQHEIEIRQMLVGNRRGQYRVLFTVTEARVVVLDARHSMRDWLEPGELDS